MTNLMNLRVEFQSSDCYHVQPEANRIKIIVPAVVFAAHCVCFHNAVLFQSESNCVYCVLLAEFVLH